MITLAIIMLLALCLSFEPVAEQVAKWTSWPVDKIKSIAKTVLFVGIGAYLIYTGVAALAVPVVGVALIVVGLALVALAVWPFFSSSSETVEGE